VLLENRNILVQNQFLTTVYNEHRQRQTYVLFSVWTSE